MSAAAAWATVEWPHQKDLKATGHQYEHQWAVTAGRWGGQVVKGTGFEIWQSLVQILQPTAIWICSW